MELEDLKKTWSNLNTGKELDENQILTMLQKRSRNLIERIDRNIRIGFAVLLMLILIFAVDDLFFSPLMIKDVNSELTIPDWILFMGIFSNILIFLTFLFFALSYYRVKRKSDFDRQLKQTLLNITATLKIYKRLFYLALFILLIAVGTGFVTGMYKGILAEAQEQGIPFANIPADSLLQAVLIGLVVLAVIVGGIFLGLRWGFRRLYGNYINKLNQTLQELEEFDDTTDT